jgi:hypothetical protein
MKIKIAIYLYFPSGAVEAYTGHKGQEVEHVMSQLQCSLCDEQGQQLRQQQQKHHQWSYLPCSQHQALASSTQALVSSASSASSVGLLLNSSW